MIMCPVHISVPPRRKEKKGERANKAENINYVKQVDEIDVDIMLAYQEDAIFLLYTSYNYLFYKVCSDLVAIFSSNTNRKSPISSVNASLEPSISALPSSPGAR